MVCGQCSTICYYVESKLINYLELVTDVLLANEIASDV